MHSPLRTRFKLPKRVTAKFFPLLRARSRERPSLDRPSFFLSDNLAFPVLFLPACYLLLSVLPPERKRRHRKPSRINWPLSLIPRLLRPFGVRCARLLKGQCEFIFDKSLTKKSTVRGKCCMEISIHCRNKIQSFIRKISHEI